MVCKNKQIVLSYHTTNLNVKDVSMNMVKVFALSVLTATIALTGCSAKRSNSEVIVAPLGVAGQGGNYPYGGGALVNNSSAIQSAAANLPNTIYFAFDSSDINSQGQAVLNQQAQFLQSYPEAKVLIAGHTDERGSREYNMALGERRARSAQSYLESQGVPAGRSEIVSYGEEQPADPSSGEGAWAKNRRAELSYP